MTNLEILCTRFRQQGGTIHQFAKKFNLESSYLLNISPELLEKEIALYKKNSTSKEI